MTFTVTDISKLVRKYSWKNKIIQFSAYIKKVYAVFYAAKAFIKKHNTSPITVGRSADKIT